jgi:hypothetical protein
MFNKYNDDNIIGTFMIHDTICVEILLKFCSSFCWIAKPTKYLDIALIFLLHSDFISSKVNLIN